MVISLSFGMIRFVPDQVLGWIGGNMQNSVGAQSEDIAGNATKGAFAGRGSITGAADRAGHDRQDRKNQATQDSQADKIASAVMEKMGGGTSPLQANRIGSKNGIGSKG